jgi:ribosomal protein S18 acetylase RimI-like enzyme
LPSSLEPPKVVRLAPRQFAALRPLLIDLLLEEQRHYAHPQLTPAEMAREMRHPPRSRFVGENIIFAARTRSRRLCGLCWCVLFDPGTGLEGEVAELYVDPAYRDHGLGAQLVEAAVDLFKRRRVSFASVWTRAGNPAAVHLYQHAGFKPTEQLVLTWLPLGPNEDSTGEPERAGNSKPLE